MDVRAAISMLFNRNLMMKAENEPNPLRRKPHLNNVESSRVDADGEMIQISEGTTLRTLKVRPNSITDFKLSNQSEFLDWKRESRCTRNYDR